ncbi:MAG: pyridoxal 5'-phosphate synthase glutaminase subunit PdxT [Nitriliruptoraceae bacterium]
MVTPGTRWIPGSRLVGASDEPELIVGIPTVGVLALQGDILEHLRALRRVGVNAMQVRNVKDLQTVDALVIPGGESTTIGKLIELFGLAEPLARRIDAGMPVLATCAGMILMAQDIVDYPQQFRLGAVPISIRRNAFGRQNDSFDTQLDVTGIDGGPLDVAFIRAPAVEAILDDEVIVLATVGDTPVMVRYHNSMLAAFHPELTGDDRIHQFFVTEML